MKGKKFFALISAALVLLFLLDKFHIICLECIHLKSFTPQNIRNYILGFGSWALGVYIGLYALNTVSLLPPIGIMSLAAGFIFGPFWGSAGIMAGSFLGTSATFFISRLLGERIVEKISKGNTRNWICHRVCG